MFQRFPKFTKLTLADRAEYEALIKDFPPVADISFATMMSWWSPLDNVKVSLLNNNLVIPYWIPGDEIYSGLTLIGTNKVDESLCTIFDFLQERGDQPRLVAVPELVIRNIQYPELFNFIDERGSHEYVIAISDYFPLENANPIRRRQIERQLRNLEYVSVEVRPLELDLIKNQHLLLEATKEWWSKNLSNIGRIEVDYLETCVTHARDFGIHNVCLFVDGKLHGFCLYQRPACDSRYIIVNHVKATHKKRLKFDLMLYLFAKYFAEQGVEFANINADMGSLRLRMFMLTLGPHDFIRKYRIEPA